MSTDRPATDDGGHVASAASRPTGRSERRRADRRTSQFALAGAVLAVALFLALATTPAAAQPTAACTPSPTTVGAGETVTLDASNATNASVAEFDVDGDDSYDLTDDADLVVETSYATPGTYEPTVRVTDGANDTDVTSCGAITVTENQEPRARLAAEPETATVDDTVRLNASRSTDPDGSIVEYRFDVDGDGAVEYTADQPAIEHAYETAGTYRATVTVVDDGGANATADAAVGVERPAPIAACSVAPTTLEVGEPLTIDATGSEHATSVAVDVDGDGTVDRTLEAAFRTTVTYGAPGTYAPTATARNDAGEETTDCGDVTVLAAENASSTGGTGASGDANGSADAGSAVGSGGANGSGGVGSATSGSDSASGVLGAIASGVGVGDGGPGSPLHAGGTVLLLGAAGWLVGRVQRTGDDPRPRGVFEWRSDRGARYAAGVLPIDDEEATAIDCDFRPDIVLLSARTDACERRRGADDASHVDGAATPAASDSIALSSGVALRTEKGIAQHALGARWPRTGAKTKNRGGSSAAAPSAAPDGEEPADADEDDRGTDPSTRSESVSGGSIDPPDAAAPRPADRGGRFVTADGESLTFPIEEAATARVSVTSADGFVIEPGGDLDATVSYRAVRLPADVELTAGSAAVAAGEERAELPTDGRPDALLLDAIGETKPEDDAQSAGAVAWSVGTVGGGEMQTAVGGDAHECVAVDGWALGLGPGGATARLDAATAEPTLVYDAPADAHACQFVGLSGPAVRGLSTGTVEVGAGGSADEATEIAVDLGCRPAFLEFWLVGGGAGETAESLSGGAGSVSLATGAARRSGDGVEQFDLQTIGSEDDEARIRVSGFTDGGFEIVLTSGLEQERAGVTLVYRAWPAAPTRGPGGDGD